MTIRRVAVVGGAGFIGSHVVDECLHNDIQVRVVDNMSSGRQKFVASEAELFDADISTDAGIQVMRRAFRDVDWVAHLAGHADVRRGLDFPLHDLTHNTIATSNVLQAMRFARCKRIFYASSSSVYGDRESDDAIPEEPPMPSQASLYGASKIASEALCQAYAKGLGFTSILGRWVLCVGPRYANGHVLDITRKVLANPTEIEVLGDGKQAKSGIDVRDLASAILAMMEHHHDDSGISRAYNVGTEDTFSILESIGIICRVLGASPKYNFTGTGWVGDNKRIQLDTERIRQIGWKPAYTMAQSIEDTVNWLLSEQCSYL